MILKHKKILLGTLVAATTAGAITAILVPTLLNKKNDGDGDDAKVNHLGLVKAIGSSKTKVEALKASLKFFGLTDKNEAAIIALSAGEEKTQYEGALYLSKIIQDKVNPTKAADKEIMTVVEGKDEVTQLKQVFITFAKAGKRTLDKTKKWPENHNDPAKDSLTFLQTLSKENKVIKSKKDDKQKQANAKSDFETKEYGIIYIFSKFVKAKTTIKASTLNSSYNHAIDADSKAVNEFITYLLTLKPGGSIVAADLKDHITFKKETSPAATGTTDGKGTFTFKFKTYTDKVTISDFDNSKVKAHTVTISPASQNKIADEIAKSDIDKSKLPQGVTIKGVAPTTGVTNDGTLVTVTFSDNTTAQVTTSLTYAKKAFDYLSTITPEIKLTTQETTAAGKILPSAYETPTTRAKVEKIWTNLIDVANLSTNITTKLKGTIVAGNIVFVPDDNAGTLKVKFTSGTDSIEFDVTDSLSQKDIFLNQVQDDLIHLTVANINKALKAKAAVSNTTLATAYTFPTNVSVTSGKTTFDLTLTKGNVDVNKGEISYTFTIVEQGKSVTLTGPISGGTLSGFQTNLTDTQKKADMVKWLTSTIKITASKQTTVNPSTVKTPLATQLFQAWVGSNHNTYGATLVVTNVKKSGDGAISFTATYTIGKETATSTVTMTGFMSDAALADKAITDTVAEFKSLKNGTTSLSPIVLPSTLSTKTTPAGIGFTQPTNIHGTTVTYLVKSTADAAGTLTVTATIAKTGGTTQTTTFTLSGYQTTAAALAKAKADAKAFVNGLTYPKQDDALHDANLFGAIDTAKQAALTAITGVGTPTAATAMASSATAGTEITKVLAAINTYTSSTGTTAADQATVNGVVVTDLKLPKASNTALPSTVSQPGNQTAKTTTVSFTTWTHDDGKGEISWAATVTKGTATKTLTGKITGYQTTAGAGAAADQAAVNGVVVKDINLPTASSTALPSTVSKPGNQTVNTTTVSFTTWTHDDGKGEISWAATVTKGAATKTLTGKITGYQTTAGAGAAADQATVNGVVVGDLNLPKASNTALPSTVSQPGNKTVKTTTVSFTTWTQNDTTGEITWAATVTKGAATKTLNGKITGYQTTAGAGAAADQATVNGVAVGDIKLPQASNTALPSTVSQPGNKTVKTTTVSFTTWTHDDGKGEISWAATVTKGAATKTLTGKITGYQTTAGAGAAADQATVNGVVVTDINLPKASNTALPSTVSKPGNKTVKTTTVSYTTWTADDGKGEISWAATVTKGAATKTLTGKITGYQTTAAADQATVNGVAVGDLVGLPTGVSTKQATTETQPGNQTVKTTTVSFTTWTQNDTTGEITWAATVTKGAATKTLNGKITGYQTTAQKATADAQTALNAEQARVNGLTSTGSVTTEVKDSIKPANTPFTAALATAAGVTTNLDTTKFTYTYEGTTGGIKVTVKSISHSSLTATPTPSLIAVTWKPNTVAPVTPPATVKPQDTLSDAIKTALGAGLTGAAVPAKATETPAVAAAAIKTVADIKTYTGKDLTAIAGIATGAKVSAKVGTTAKTVDIEIAIAGATGAKAKLTFVLTGLA